MATPIINAQLDAMNETLIRIANNLGAYDSPATWAAIQARVRANIIGQLVQPGDQLTAEMAETLTATVTGTGVTAATVSKDTFLEAAGTHHRDYEFIYDGAMWRYLGEAVTLSDYGITPTGTAVEGDVINIHRTATAYDFDVEGIDQEIPANPQYKHVLSLIMHPVYVLQNFDPPQYLYAVTAAQWPDGMPAGTYTITLNSGAYNGGITQDGTYAFTTTKTIPVGGGIRHSAIGVYQSSSYTKAQITSGTFTTYDADRLTTLESGLATTESDTGTSLGTTTASDPAKKSGDYINFSQRQAYGSNRWSTCWLRQWLNSDEATFTFAPKTIWSRPVSGSIEGFLHNLDPELRAVLGKIRKRYALPVADGYGYEDIEDYVTLDTMLDVYGSQNNSISEGPVDGSGTVKRTTAMALWAGSSQADKIKYQGATARSWWLSSTHPSYANDERSVFTSGALHDSIALNPGGVVPRLQII